MSQHLQPAGPTTKPPPYSPRIIECPQPDPPELPPVELRALQRPYPAHLPNQRLLALNNRHTTGDEESNAYRDESRAYPPSYIPPHGKDDPETEVIFANRSPPRARPLLCCTRRCCVFVFFILVIAVGVPVGYIMAKKAQFEQHQAAKHKLGT